VDKSNPTIYDVASRAKVSVATVSRHINGTSKLSAASQRRVEKAIAELGFVANPLAQQLSSGKTKIIGVVFPKDFMIEEVPGVERESMLYVDMLLRSIETEGSKANYSILLTFASLDEKERIEQLQRIGASVDGLIALERVFTPKILKSIGLRVPLVLIASGIRSSQYDSVSISNAKAMHEIAEHLYVDHGVRTAGLITGRLSSPDSRERRDGFIERFSQLGGKVKLTDIMESDWTVRSGYVAMTERLKSKHKLPQCIVAANDQTALGAMNALVENGFNVPDDVMLTGFDDTPMSFFMTPPLTTVRQDIFGMGKEAVRLLLDAIANPGRKKQNVTLETELVVRNSCGCSTSKGLNLMRELAS
jgi:LacI family transcriptional regulator